MKQITLLVCLAFLLSISISSVSNAQSEKEKKAPSSQLMVVHIDEVLPAKNAEYEKLSKQFVSEMTKHGIKDVTFHTSRSDENEYMWASPIKNMAELDKKWYAELMDKMGKEAFAKMFDDMDHCYNKHYSVIVEANYDLSMLPQNPATINENTYRKFTWYYFEPLDMDKAYAVAKDFKELYTSNGITDYNYILHEPLFSNDGNSFVVMGWAKSKEEYDAMQEKLDAKLGEKRQALFDKVNAITVKKVVKEAEYLPGLSYEPRQLVKAK
ncbi:MAG: hypothetical protein HKN75_07355 [Bacteroidia bacterium]|nr:hypothetical protein [Bacteroidia bacterium]